MISSEDNQKIENPNEEEKKALILNEREEIDFKNTLEFALKNLAGEHNRLVNAIKIIKEFLSMKETAKLKSADIIKEYSKILAQLKKINNLSADEVKEFEAVSEVLHYYSNAKPLKQGKFLEIFKFTIDETLKSINSRELKFELPTAEDKEKLTKAEKIAERNGTNRSATRFSNAPTLTAIFLGMVEGMGLYFLGNHFFPNLISVDTGTTVSFFMGATLILSLEIAVIGFTQRTILQCLIDTPVAIVRHLVESREAQVEPGETDALLITDPNNLVSSYSDLISGYNTIVTSYGSINSEVSDVNPSPTSKIEDDLIIIEDNLQNSTIPSSATPSLVASSLKEEANLDEEEEPLIDNLYSALPHNKR
jgi:hypothetical protein